MKRRAFLGRAAAPVVFPVLKMCGAACAAGLPESGGLVATPEKRAEYLDRMLKEICGLGPRPIGSTALARAREIVAREMRRALPRVETDSFPLECWQVENTYALFVGTRKIEAYPLIGTTGTPAGGITGVLRKSAGGAKHYEVVDRTAGNALSYVAVYNGKARPVSASIEEYRKLPAMMAGARDIPFLEEAVEKKMPVRVIAPIRITPNVMEANVIGTLPGESADEILFIAHLDTVYNTPGANDNTASVIIMLMLAHAASGKRPVKTARFLATTSEEYGAFRGAANYVERRKREETLRNIKYIVNFDSGTWNPDVEIWTEDKELQALMRNIGRELDIDGAPKEILKSGFALDAKPFAESGARAIYVESNGQDKIHLWHRPIDTPANVQGLMVEINFRLFNEYRRRVEKM